MKYVYAWNFNIIYTFILEIKEPIIFTWLNFTFVICTPYTFSGSHFENCHV